MQRFKEGTKLGSYTIVRLVGRGGMGEVYEAYEHTLDRRVALKVISPQKPGSKSEKEMIDRFMREARTLAQVNHPNVVTIYAIDQIENTQFIAMEYVEGAQLSELFSMFTFSGDEATPMFFQLLKGMAALHDRDIIHRDIKPHNLMLRPDGQIKILDFGIAKRTGDEDEAERAKKLVGTMAYLPPEVIHGARADKRSDLWSLGAIFYEAVVGQTLVGLDGEKVKGAKAYPESGVVLPLECLKRVPHEMRMIISKLCEPTPQMRYETAQQAMEDLKIYQKNRPTLPPTFFKALSRIVENIGQVKVNADMSQLRDGKGKRAFTEAIFTVDSSIEGSEQPQSIKPPFTETITQDNVFEVTRDSIMARQRVRKKLSRQRKLSKWRPVFITMMILALIGGTGFWFYQHPMDLTPLKKRYAAFMAPNPEALQSRRPLPQLAAPTRGTTLWLYPTQVPTLTWSTVISSGEYELQISPDKDFQTLIVREAVAGNSFRPDQALGEGTYYWRLSPISASKVVGPSEFSIGSLGTIKPTSPTPGQILEMERSETTAEVEFAWKCKRFVQSYRLQVSLQTSFNNPLKDEVVNDCTLKYVRYPKGTYFWRVRSIEPTVAKNAWSSVASFGVKAAKPSKLTSTPKLPAVKKAAAVVPPLEKPVERIVASVEKTSPPEETKAAPQLLDAIQVFTLKFTNLVKTAQNAIAGNPQPSEFPQFRWMEVEGAKAYKLELSRSADFSKIIEQKTVTGAAEFEWKQVVPEQIYWRVAAIVDGEGPFSRTGKMEVRLPAPSWGSAYSYNVKDQAFLEWEPVPYAQFYIVQWSTSQDMSGPSEKIVGEVKTPLDLNGGQLFVRIAVANKFGHRMSEYSNVARIRASTKPAP